MIQGIKTKTLENYNYFGIKQLLFLSISHIYKSTIFQ